jgi:hypothetical protein
LFNWVAIAEEEVSFDLVNFAKTITGGENVDEDNINERIHCDAIDSGFDCFTDEKIVNGE